MPYLSSSDVVFHEEALMYVPLAIIKGNRWALVDVCALLDAVPVVYAFYDQLYSPSGRQIQRNEYWKINNK